MSSFDPSVISAIPGMTGDPIGAESKALTLKDMLDRTQLNQLQLGTAKREAAERAQVDQVLKGSDYSTPQGLASTVAKVNKVSPRAAMDLMKFGQQYQSGQAQAQVDQLELLDKRQGLIVSAIDPIVSQARAMKNQGASDLDVKAWITQQMPQALQGLRSMTLPDGKPALPDDQLKMVTGVPGGYTLQTLEGWEAKSKAGQAAIKQRLDQFRADIQARTESERERADTEHQRHDEAMEELALGKQSQAQFTDNQRDLLAALAVRSVNLPAGLRSQAQIKATLAGLLQKNPNRTPDEIADDIKSGKLQLAAETKGAQVAGGQIGKVALSANELDTFGDQTIAASDALPRGRFVPWNRLRQLGEASISDPKLLLFKAKMQALENAYNQLAARSGTDVEKRAHIHDLFNAANSPAAVETLVAALKQEADAARSAANRTIAETSGAAIPGTAPPDQGTPPPAAAPAPLPGAAAAPAAAAAPPAAPAGLPPGWSVQVH